MKIFWRVTEFLLTFIVGAVKIIGVFTMGVIYLSITLVLALIGVNVKAAVLDSALNRLKD